MLLHASARSVSIDRGKNPALVESRLLPGTEQLFSAASLISMHQTS